MAAELWRRILDENFPAPNDPMLGGAPDRGFGAADAQSTGKPGGNANTRGGVACVGKAAIVATTLLLTVILALVVILGAGSVGSSARTLDNRLMEEGLVRGAFRSVVVRASAISEYPNPYYWVKLGPGLVHEINAAFIAPRVATPKPFHAVWFGMIIDGNPISPNSALKLRFSDGRSAEIRTRIRHGRITFFARNWQWVLGLQRSRYVGRLTVLTAIRFDRLWRRADRRKQGTNG